MKRMKWAIAILLALTAACCVSCNGEAEQEELVVRDLSGEVTEFVAGEYPWALAEDGESFRWGYNVYVSKTNAERELVISGNRYEGLTDTPQTEHGEYYRSGDWFGYDGGVFLGGEKMLDEACVGMVASEFDGNAVLIFTNTADNAYVYSAKKSDGQWSLDREGRMELGSRVQLIYYSWPSSTHAPAKTMYLVTDSQLVQLSVGTYLGSRESDFGTVVKSVVETPDYWRMLDPTSAVELHGKLYIGDMFGVVEYDPAAGTFLYYPVVSLAVVG